MLFKVFRCFWMLLDVFGCFRMFLVVFGLFWTCFLTKSVWFSNLCCTWFSRVFRQKWWFWAVLKFGNCIRNCFWFLRWQRAMLIGLASEPLLKTNILQGFQRFIGGLFLFFNALRTFNTPWSELFSIAKTNNHFDKTNSGLMGPEEETIATCHPWGPSCWRKSDVVFWDILVRSFYWWFWYFCVYFRVFCIFWSGFGIFWWNKYVIQKNTHTHIKSKWCSLFKKCLTFLFFGFALGSISSWAKTRHNETSGPF